MLKRHLLIVMTIVTVAAVAPAAATANSIPNLPFGVHQAYIADASGNPENTNLLLTGSVSVNSVTGLIITCSSAAISMEVNDDGTTWIHAFFAQNCTTNVPGCSARVEQSFGSWGDRFGFDTSSSSFKDYINVDVNITLYSPGCPVGGTFTESGVLSPSISISGGSVTATFSGGSSGSITGPIGSATFSGTFTGIAGSGTQLIY